MRTIMLSRDERRYRHLECRELQARYGELLPCEAYADIGADYHLWVDGRAPKRSLAARLSEAALAAVRLLRKAFDSRSRGAK
jgi:hypothetical protein